MENVHHAHYKKYLNYYLSSNKFFTFITESKDERINIRFTNIICFKQHYASHIIHSAYEVLLFLLFQKTTSVVKARR